VSNKIYEILLTENFYDVEKLLDNFTFRVD